MSAHDSTNPSTDPSVSGRGSSKKLQTFLKRFGVLGFLFFLVKGLVWVAIFTLGWKGCNELRDPEGAGMSSDYPQASAHKIAAFEAFDHAAFILLVFKVEKRKTLGSAALLIPDHGDMLHFRHFPDEFLQMAILRLVSEVANVNSHSIPCYPIKHKN